MVVRSSSGLARSRLACGRRPPLDRQRPQRRRNGVTPNEVADLERAATSTSEASYMEHDTFTGTARAMHARPSRNTPVLVVRRIQS